MSICKTLAVTLSLTALTGTVQAGLVDRGGGKIYDTTRNITWLADMNYANTSGYADTDLFGTGHVSTDGVMTWYAANHWAETLAYGGYSDWRLPTLIVMDPTCSYRYDTEFVNASQGVGCTGGELSGLFNVDLKQAGNTALFKNVQSSYYWAETAYSLFPQYDGGAFLTSVGVQHSHHKSFGAYVVAVRDGDVAASVPEPQSLALALLALGAAAVARKRRLR